jgi:hypothetical protein
VIAGCEPGLLETLDEAGLAQVLLAQELEALGKGPSAAFSLAERTQVGQDSDRLVVFAGFLGIDEDADLLPGSFFAVPLQNSAGAVTARRSATWCCG